MLGRVMASMSSLTKTPLVHLIVSLAPVQDPEAVVAAVAMALATTEDVKVTEGVTVRHLPHPLLHLHPAVGPLLAPGPALTPAAVDDPHAVAVIIITHIVAVGITTVLHHAGTGPTLAHTAALHHDIDTLIADTTGPAQDPAPGLLVTGAGRAGV